MSVEKKGVTWGALWLGLVVGFFIGSIIIYFILKGFVKEYMDAIFGSMLGGSTSDNKVKELVNGFMYKWWIQALVVGLVASLVTAIMNKKNALFDGIVTGVLIFCIGSLFVFYIGMILTMVTADSSGISKTFFKDTSNMWRGILWWDIKWNYTYLIGGAIGGFMAQTILRKQTKKGDISVETVSKEQIGEDMNDSLPPALTEKKDSTISPPEKEENKSYSNLPEKPMTPALSAEKPMESAPSAEKDIPINKETPTEKPTLLAPLDNIKKGPPPPTVLPGSGSKM